MSVKTYQLFCGNCGYKRFTKGNDIQDLVQVNLACVPGGSPFVDPFTKKVVIPSSTSRVKSFKCPGCGYVIKAKKITLIETIEDDQSDQSDPK